MSLNYTELRSDDRSENLVFTKICFSPHNTWYEICIEDAYCWGNFSGLEGRFKRAWHAFFAKPISYAGMIIQDKDRLETFFSECQRILAHDEKGERTDDAICTPSETKKTGQKSISRKAEKQLEWRLPRHPCDAQRKSL